MPDDAPDTDDPFSTGPSSSSFDEGRDWDADAPLGSESSSWGDRSAFALDMARMWVKEHQTATMLGAFAVGVFTGSILRD